MLVGIIPLGKPTKIDAASSFLGGERISTLISNVMAGRHWIAIPPRLECLDADLRLGWCIDRGDACFRRSETF